MNCCRRGKFSTLFEEIFGNTICSDESDVEHELESNDEYLSDDEYASDHTSEGEFEPDEYESEVDPQLELEHELEHEVKPESVLEPRVKAVITPVIPVKPITPVKMGWKWKLICGI